jgi:signal peptidase
MTVRTANDFNREYMFRNWIGETTISKQSPKGKPIKTAIFYTLLISAVLLAFFYSGSKGSGKTFGPFAYYTVLTTSMQDVYPQGSLVTSWAVKPNEPLQAGLESGSDIIFAKDDQTIVVHRIVEIMEDYEESGYRAFRTQGVNNPNPDTWITYEGNVIGRVTWHLPYAGNTLAMIAENLLWVIAGVVLLAFIATLLKVVFKKDPAKAQR